MANHQKVTIIDTGCANFSSVRFALARLGIEAQISADKSVIRQADKLILPGVGTAVAAMQKLNDRHLPELVRSLKQPVLGICLGMQMMGLASEESMNSGTACIKTLGITPGTVRLMQTGDLPLPHMGWDQVTHDGSCPLFAGLKSGTYFYFVHSYAMDVTKDTVGVCTYGSQFTAVFQHDNFFGTQFHPEKSGAAGARLLKNFIEL